MARKIFISAGHGGIDAGASHGGYTERDLTISFRNNLVKELSKLRISASTDPDTNALAQTLAFIKGKFGVKDILLDIHFNAGGGTGTEVIIPDVYSPFEKQLAQRIADSISTVTGLKKRGGGVKTEKDTARKSLGWMRPNSENILIEMCFLDNKLDMAVYTVNEFKLAKEIAKILSDFSKI
jgi:N-acetylmuramoyl-L-alanine amidase